MKKIITSLALICAAVTMNAQTATNFTATDCKGGSHTLFTELDNGKVVVMVWVMPCSMCVSGGENAFNAVQTFATSNPGKVIYYLIDDIGDNNCATLHSWATLNSIDTSKISVFDNSGNVISQIPYGGPAMPRVMVVGGTSHHVYFNGANTTAGTQAQIQTAIASAISAVSVNEVTSKVQFSISPNPVTEQLTITYTTAIQKVGIYSVAGQLVKEIPCNGKVNPSVSMSGISNGIYVVKITDINGKTGIQKIVKE